MVKRPAELTYSRFNTGLLALSQALAAISAGVVLAVSALSGAVLAPRESLATLPLALQFGATMLFAYPASLLMRRVGRRLGFSLGAALGAAGGALAAAGLLSSSFGWFSAGSFLIGGYNACVLFYRYAAADNAPPHERGRAIGLVLAGGVASIAGPYLAGLTKDSLAVTYAGAYLSLVPLALVSLLVLQFFEVDPRPARNQPEAPPPARPFRMMARQPLTALLSGVVGYSLMTLVMSATPLAMKGHAHGFSQSAALMQWHLVFMFAPALFSGALVKRVGPTTTIGAGLLVYIVCAAMTLTGRGTLPEYTATLILNGVGWSLITVAATTLLMDTYAPAERERVQGANDIIVFASAAAAAAASGFLQARIGWAGVNVVVLLVAASMGAVLSWFVLMPRAQPMVALTEG